MSMKISCSVIMPQIRKMAYLFSFYEEKSGQYDIRTIYDHHGIKILNVDETGNVTFMVYGYMEPLEAMGELWEYWYMIQWYAQYHRRTDIHTL